MFSKNYIQSKKIFYTKFGIIKFFAEKKLKKLLTTRKFKLLYLFGLFNHYLMHQRKSKIRVSNKQAKKGLVRKL
jgi:hypothetical protein